MTKDGWVLRLKDESKEEGMEGEFYYCDDSEDDSFLADNLNKATILYNKDAAIAEMKHYEKSMFERFGENAICNAGYTHMMKNFEFYEVEVEFPES